MLKKSFFMCEHSNHNYKGELHFYVALGILLFLSGTIMIIIPILTGNLAFVLSLSWLLLLCALLSFIRPFIYGRGFADMVMGICTGVFYAVASVATSFSDIQIINGSRLILSFMLIFSGISCILAFSSFIHITVLPFLVITGFAELICGILILTGLPSYNVFYIYWLVGLLLILSSFDYFTQCKILLQSIDKRKIQI
jgi:hypothetical protein